MFSENTSSLTDIELLRYSRHLLLPEIDVIGQQRLRAARVLMVGMGGLGCPAAIYLAASGVGTLVLADSDTVELSNLQRQIAYRTADIGRLKVEAVADTLKALNPHIEIQCLPEQLTGTALEQAVAEVDVVLDGSDSFATRFEVNRVCRAQAVPLVSAALIGVDAQLSVFDFRRKDSPCYACVYPEHPEVQTENGCAADTDRACSNSGVLAPLAGMFGSLQAIECIKLIVGFGEPYVGRLVSFDAASTQWRSRRVQQDPACAVCALRQAQGER